MQPQIKLNFYKFYSIFHEAKKPIKTINNGPLINDYYLKIEYFPTTNSKINLY